MSSVQEVVDGIHVVVPLVDRGFSVILGWIGDSVEDANVGSIHCVDGSLETIEVLKAKFTIDGVHRLLSRIQFSVVDIFNEWNPSGGDVCILPFISISNIDFIVYFLFY